MPAPPSSVTCSATLGSATSPRGDVDLPSWADECTVREVTDIMAVDGAEVGTGHQLDRTTPPSLAGLVAPAPDHLTATFPA